MLVEMPWMQRFVLYLGHLSYATTVVLAALLLGAGIGSLTGARVGHTRVVALGLVLPLLLLVVNQALGPLFQATLGWPFGFRVLPSAGILVPAGFVMGFPFAVGMSSFGDEHKAWFWAMNGSASVLASVFSLALSMVVGLSSAAICGVGFYALAYVLLRVHERPA
jgi:hypothetical protein